MEDIKDYRDMRFVNEESTEHKPKVRKDTKKWCKGVEGREHVWTLGKTDYRGFMFQRWICDNCQRTAYKKQIKLGKV